ncbi:MAG: Unknown protein [uncultured Campylobacterales bacterium]|uniref:Uncharacterized protein n=1 Tax=uncultured Campylobacterales bacterium TaxID=352960 RepID=A0A6S6SLK1_9BACT|nr:MAG: Unknown protein [uncultured Campylobacterales bacterium]
MTEVIISDNDLDHSTINVSTRRTLKEIWDEQIVDIRTDLQSNFTSDTTLRRNMLNSLNEIQEHILDDIDVNNLLQQINCDIDKNEVSNGISINKIIHFYIIGKIVDNITSLPHKNNNKVTIKKIDNWLFNSAKTSEVSLGMQIGSIADFITTNQIYNISNGTVFICQLMNNGGLTCNSCQTGELNIQNKLSKILSSFFSKNTGIIFDEESQANDFMNLKKSNNLNFKCGNCVTNFNNLNNAKKIF